MTDTSQLPSGEHPVCPRCGAPAGEGLWCESCGLNLKQRDLPSADAYAAGIREQQWQTAERDKRRAVTDKARAEAGALRETQRRQRALKTETLRRERRERRAVLRARLARPMKVAGLVALGLLVSLLALGAVWHFTGWDAPALGVSPVRDDESDTHAAVSSDAPASTEQSADSSTPATDAPACSPDAALAELNRRGYLDGPLGSAAVGAGQVACVDLNGDGLDDMALTRRTAGSGGDVGWGVFVATSTGSWDLAFFHEQPAHVAIKAADEAVLRLAPRYLPGDANCCPTGGFEIEKYADVNGEVRVVNTGLRPGTTPPAGFYDQPDSSATLTLCDSVTVTPNTDQAFGNIRVDPGLGCGSIRRLLLTWAADGYPGKGPPGLDCTSAVNETGLTTSSFDCSKDGEIVKFDST